MVGMQWQTPPVKLSCLQQVKRWRRKSIIHLDFDQNKINIAWKIREGHRQRVKEKKKCLVKNVKIFILNQEHIPWDFYIHKKERKEWMKPPYRLEIRDLGLKRGRFVANVKYKIKPRLDEFSYNNGTLPFGCAGFRHCAPQRNNHEEMLIICKMQIRKIISGYF